MSSIGVSAISFGLVFGGALLGLFIGNRLPEHHQSSGTKDVVRMGMGMVGTIAALVLGLLVSSAKTFCDGQRDELMQMSSNVVVVDRLLQHYGPEANGARESLRLAVGRILARIWPEERMGKAALLPMAARNEDVYDQIDALAPKDDQQRALQSRAMSLMLSMGHALADIRADICSGIDTATDRDHFLVDNHFCQLGNLFASKRHDRSQLFRRGIVRVRGLLVDHGVVFALRRSAAGFERAVASCICDSWSLNSPSKQSWGFSKISCVDFADFCWSSSPFTTTPSSLSS